MKRFGAVAGTKSLPLEEAVILCGLDLQLVRHFLPGLLLF